jgi:hypothetical protein
MSGLIIGYEINTRGADVVVEKKSGKNAAKVAQSSAVAGAQPPSPALAAALAAADRAYARLLTVRGPGVGPLAERLSQLRQLARRVSGEAALAPALAGLAAEFKRAEAAFASLAEAPVEVGGDNSGGGLFGCGVGKAAEEHAARLAARRATQLSALDASLAKSLAQHAAQIEAIGAALAAHKADASHIASHPL